MASRTGRFVLALAGLVAVGALVVLGYATSSPGQGARLAVALVSVPGELAGGDSGGVTGRLGASRSGDKACFWISDSSQGAERVYLLFARMYSATSALALVDQHDRTIAKVGDMVTAINAAPRPGAAPEFCPAGAGMTVYDVSRTND